MLVIQSEVDNIKRDTFTHTHKHMPETIVNDKQQQKSFQEFKGKYRILLWTYNPVFQPSFLLSFHLGLYLRSRWPRDSKR